MRAPAETTALTPILATYHGTFHADDVLAYAILRQALDLNRP